MDAQSRPEGSPPVQGAAGKPRQVALQAADAPGRAGLAALAVGADGGADRAWGGVGQVI